MKRLSDNQLIVLLPITVVAATALGVVAAVAFHMGATTAGFVFTALSLAAWLCLIAEFFLFYDAVIDRWLAKDRSVLTAAWFAVSLLSAFILTPDKTLDWGTFIVAASIFAMLFLLPLTIAMAYGKCVKSFLRGRWDRLFPKKRVREELTEDTRIEAALTASPCPAGMKQEDEVRHYEGLVSQVPTQTVGMLPAPLQTNDALFLLVLFREDGYLGADFQPLLKKEDDAVNQSLYAYIASAICAALRIKKGKWVIFEKFWSLNNGAQLAGNLKYTNRNNPTEQQRHIAKLLRKATRLRPKLATYDLEEFTKI